MGVDFEEKLKKSQDFKFRGDSVNNADFYLFHLFILHC